MCSKTTHSEMTCNKQNTLPLQVVTTSTTEPSQARTTL